VLSLEFGQLRIFGEIDVGSKILQVPDPPCAASSVGRLMHIQAEAGQIKIARFDGSTGCRSRCASAASRDEKR
jgi:hypothetical protein